MTVRGQLQYINFNLGVNTSEKNVNLFSVPDQVLELLVEIVIDDSLSVSWERPAQPNDYTLNYPVSVKKVRAGGCVSRDCPSHC